VTDKLMNKLLSESKWNWYWYYSIQPYRIPLWCQFCESTCK